MKATGVELWEKAKRIIPGGNQLLSKKAERFLPELWPSYYAKAKGCEVWDLDGKHYYDFAQMGVGACILGYADQDIDQAVIKAIRDGSMCSLNCFEEVELAERLIDIHPWAQMARFAKTGGEACAVAIRIARAASAKSKVAFCGYHGWHDWYISSNLADSSNLDGQLLPGLEPAGVPRELTHTALPFSYNKIDELAALIDHYPTEIGVIIVEPQRGQAPEKGFLESLRDIANQIGAVLIFDEITSGFRNNIGGIHLTYGVEPDMAVFGKALGNGYPISAVIGKREVMEAARTTFISSTMWTERIGFVAALETINKMESHKVPQRVNEFGLRINRGWETLSAKHNLPIQIDGIPALTHLKFDVENSPACQTLYAQEMLGRGFLVGSAVYSTFAYSNRIIDQFIDASDIAFEIIKEAIDADDILQHLKGGIIQTGFKRLN